MERLTRVIKGYGKDVVVYTKGKYEDTTAGEMEVKDVRNVMGKLSDYENTGLTPAEIRELKERDTAKAPVPFPVDAERRLCRGIGFAQSADRDSGRRTDMQLEKILEELGEYICDDLCYYRETSVDENDGEMEEICAGCKVGGYLKAIRKHMNDGWIPVEETLPNGGIDVEVTVRRGYRTIGYYNELYEEWYSTDESGLIDVIAWKEPSEPYHPERSMKE